MRIIIFILFTIAFTALSAYPDFIFSGLDKVWFDNAGDFWMVYEPEHFDNQVLEDLHDLVISTTGGTWQLPDSFEQTFYPGTIDCYINLSEEIPGFVINRQSDIFTVNNAEYEYEPLRWGLESGYEIDLRPLQDGQTAHLFRYAIYNYSLIIPVWIKTDSESDNLSTSHLNIRVMDDQGHAVENFPCRFYLGNPEDGHYETSFTWADGHFAYNSPSMLYQFRLIDPLSEELVAERLAYLEPGETLDWFVTIPCPHIIDHQGPSLTLRPNVLHRGANNAVVISYNRYWELTTNSTISLYDLRGRKIQTSCFSQNGIFPYYLPPLPSGIYIISIRESGKTLASQRLTIIK